MLLQVNWILTGVVVAEAIFAYRGIGSLLLKAALFGDIYVVQALTLLALAVAVGTQFVGDVAYMLLDPKIRLRGAMAELGISGPQRLALGHPPLMGAVLHSRDGQSVVGGKSG